MKIILNSIVCSVILMASAFSSTGELNSMKLKGQRASMQNPQANGQIEICGWAGVLQDNERFTHKSYSNSFPISATESVIETLVELVAESPDMEVCGTGVYRETYGFAGRTLKVHLTTIQ